MDIAKGRRRGRRTSTSVDAVSPRGRRRRAVGHAHDRRITEHTALPPSADALAAACSADARSSPASPASPSPPARAVVARLAATPIAERGVNYDVGAALFGGLTRTPWTTGARRARHGRHPRRARVHRGAHRGQRGRSARGGGRPRRRARAARVARAPPVRRHAGRRDRAVRHRRRRRRDDARGRSATSSCRSASSTRCSSPASSPEPTSGSAPPTSPSADFVRLGRDLNAFLADAVAAVRPAFGGPLTYSSGMWEDVDWGPFDMVGVDLYRDASNEATYRAGRARPAPSRQARRDHRVRVLQLRRRRRSGRRGVHDRRLVAARSPCSPGTPSATSRSRPTTSPSCSTCSRPRTSTARSSGRSSNRTARTRPDPRRDLDMAGFADRALRRRLRDHGTLDAEGRLRHHRPPLPLNARPSLASGPIGPERRRGAASVAIGNIGGPPCRSNPTAHAARPRTSTHDLAGWDIGAVAALDWAPWGSRGDARAKVLASGDGYFLALVEAEPATDGRSARARLRRDALRPRRHPAHARRGAWARATPTSPAAGSVHTDFTTESGATYLSIFKL